MSYPPSVFVENHPTSLQALIHEQPFATLVIAVGMLPVACHVPLLLNEVEPGGEIWLEGHISAVNPIATGDECCPVLAIFHGPQHYISPSWYPSKATHPAVVPTWNYVAVHAHGELMRTRDPHWLRTHLAALSDIMERDRQEPWRLDDLPTDALRQAVDALVGLRLRITQLYGIHKLSQNKPPTDRLGVRHGLEAVASAAALAVAARIDVSDVDEPT
ncbi:hypothetical protein ADT28_00585 (plasmid) [Xylella fastidiosa]|uniref:Transcriptional regulator n=2 Tax=Xylella fastidiosa TaxID=2371 RepID=Q9PBU7_XYLFA|nr:FMN-binding negative transcriptional regulator [Xylella fastidiosa]AAF84840.1 transcriptional regulator [Xylella fastidiosa 9a5c]ETE33191.1 transcriptional regulator [Xylella fastidiosa 32]KQH73148.1 hypothetical protein AOT81_09840 [Xylella fastidiosa]KXB09936.1 hypothetical protein ADT29_00560 [Xylella fastidiosa]KXB18465.1 hypothetical protein ADT28_00585 [Xylella fastidiosa]